VSLFIFFQKKITGLGDPFQEKICTDFGFYYFIRFLRPLHIFSKSVFLSLNEPFETLTMNKQSKLCLPLRIVTYTNLRSFFNYSGLQKKGLCCKFLLKTMSLMTHENLESGVLKFFEINNGVPFSHQKPFPNKPLPNTYTVKYKRLEMLTE
jgi:hypothetical protein